VGPLPPRPPVWRSLRWMLTFSRNSAAPDVVQAMPLDLARLAAPVPRLRLAWLGHSATYAAFPGARVLLDPMLGDRASPLGFVGPRRLVPPPCAPEALPGVDLVVLSHDHYDHLDAGTIRRLVRRFDPPFVVPLGLDGFVRTLGARRVIALDWWDVADVAGLNVTAIPAQHFSGRGLRRNRHLWMGAHVSDGATHLLYAGDTGATTYLADARTRLGAPDVLLMPVGAYAPEWFMAEVHARPADAARMARESGARKVLPVHYGTFVLADDAFAAPLDAFVAAAAAEGIAGRVVPWRVGEGWDVPAPAESEARGHG
jgi:N-acyl-phosphatidylethanolamine-hydrolysing phospholipase D